MHRDVPYEVPADGYELAEKIAAVELGLPKEGLELRSFRKHPIEK